VTTKTSNAAVDIKGAKGPLHLTTSNGPIKVTGGTELVEMETSNGSITAECPKARVSAWTSNGSIHYTGALADGKHVFKTSNGRIVLALPSDARFKLDAETSHGRITNKFRFDRQEDKSRTHLRGVVGDSPDTSILVRSSNGNIDIHPHN
jgi:DUF4097 and DUF4098 domain-containing protein YvlB